MNKHVFEIKRVFPGEGPARFNVAAWQKADEDHIVLVGREVQNPGKGKMPDKGRLVLYEIDEDGSVVHERVLWESLHQNFFLEDARALYLPDGSINIGLTAVLKAKNGYSPFPAMVRIRSGTAWSGELPPVCIVHAHGPGKNLTPVSKYLFLFRPEAPEYHHKLLLFDTSNSDPGSSYDINFPTDLPWAEWRIGTTMPPLWVDDKRAILIIHGISIVENKFIYSIGRAMLYKYRGKYRVKVHPEALITPTTFFEKGKKMERELHPKLRRVVYACGGVIKRKEPNILNLYVNVGDRNTYEVRLSLDKLKKGLF